MRSFEATAVNTGKQLFTHFQCSSSQKPYHQKGLHFSISRSLCSPFVSFSKYGSIRNTHQTSGKKKVNSVCLAWMCAYVRCRKHCITAGPRDQRMREVIQSDLADDTDQKGVVPSIRASSGGHHCFCFHLRNLTFGPRPLWEK